MSRTRTSVPTAKPKISNQCKICRLLKTDPTLWREIHQKVMNDKISQAKVCAWANQRLEVINASLAEDKQVTPFVPQNFSNHFRFHMDDAIKLNMQLSGDSGASLVVESDKHFTTEEVDVADAFIKNWVAELDDYTLLTTMIKTLEEELFQLELDMREEKAKQKQNGLRSRTNVNRLRDFSVGVKDLMALKKDLVALRNTSAIAGTAVKAAIELVTVNFLDQVMKASQESLDTLNAAYPGETLQVEVVAMLRQRMGEAVKLMIPDITSKVYKEYKLK